MSVRGGAGQTGLHRGDENDLLLLVARYFSPEARERIIEAGAAYAGATRLDAVFERPAYMDGCASLLAPRKKKRSGEAVTTS